jgi:hypothetical protein
MARACTICVRPDRKEIDGASVSGEPIRTVARRFRISRDSLGRHLRAHVSPALVKVAARREAKESISLLQRMEALIERTEKLLVAAEESGALGQALGAIDRLWKGYELIGKVTGEIKPDGTNVQVINILASEDWLRLRTAMFTALAPYPEARTAVAQHLLLLEGGSEVA